MISLFICAECTVVCWTRTNDVHGFNGIPHNITTLEECQAACIEMNTCVAIDWEPSNAAGMTCWVVRWRYTRNTTKTGVIVHYELHRPCTG